MIPAIGMGTAFPCHVSILFSLFSFANLWPSSFIYFLSLSKEQGPVHQGRTHCLCHGVRRQGRGDRGQVLRAAWHCRDCSRQGPSQPLGDGAGKQEEVESVRQVVRTLERDLFYFHPNAYFHMPNHLLKPYRKQFLPSQDALCIDLSSMDSVRVDPQKKLAYIGAGGES